MTTLLQLDVVAKRTLNNLENVPPRDGGVAISYETGGYFLPYVSGLPHLSGVLFRQMKERWKEWLRIPVLFPDMPPVKLVFRSARAVVIASCLSFQMYLMRVKERGIQGEILRKRPKNNKKKHE